jgi:hypothetical protein
MRRVLAYAFGFIVLLAALYVGAYYALVEKRGEPFFPGTMRPGEFSAFYRINADWPQDVFRPIHELDRLLRPGYWTVWPKVS